jgi:holo-[acyl-carrier protein] synthase
MDISSCPETALAVGTDLVQIDRVAALVQRYGDRFTGRVFTDQELADCGGMVASLAARWAAKEAVAKALGTGIGKVAFQDVEVVQDGAGKPDLRLKGGAAEVAEALGLHQWAVSLSHDGGLALAFVVATGG